MIKNKELLEIIKQKKNEVSCENCKNCNLRAYHVGNGIAKRQVYLNTMLILKSVLKESRGSRNDRTGCN